MTTMMKAVVVREFGGVKKMKVETDMSVPFVGDHEVCQHYKAKAEKENFTHHGREGSTLTYKLDYISVFVFLFVLMYID